MMNLGLSGLKIQSQSQFSMEMQSSELYTDTQNHWPEVSQGSDRSERSPNLYQFTVNKRGNN